MRIQGSHRICDVVTQTYQTADIFRSLKIDFCCNGKQTIEEACAKKNIDPKVLLDLLERGIEKSATAHPSVEKMALSDVVDFIAKTYHKSLRELLVSTEFYVHKIARVHGERHSELVKIYQIFNALKAEVLTLVDFEENELFATLLKGLSLKNLIVTAEKDHTFIGGLLDELNHLSNRYEPPSDACNSYRIAFKYLKDLEYQIHEYAHTELHILFPMLLSKDE